jgi:hypothetical protein
MSLILLIAFAVATIVPCVLLWTADARERLTSDRA